MADKQDRARETAALGCCPRCGHAIPLGTYWEELPAAPERAAAWVLRHRKRSGRWCVAYSGPASAPVYQGSSDSRRSPLRELQEA